LTKLPARIAIATALGGFALAAHAGSKEKTRPVPSITADAERQTAFETHVRPVIEHRCVVCHACYDAPCQLVLSSPDGIARGASQENVYDTSRLRAMAPTRLGVDAKTPAAWPAKGFVPIIGHAVGADSLFVRMLSLGRANPFPPGERLPKGVELDIGRALTCPRIEAFDAYAEKHPLGGMPYGTAPLSDDEIGILAMWATRGAPLPSQPAPLPPRARDAVQRWESFLNGKSLQERVVARYLYEHWFVAHLYFDDLPEGPFFQVVRSRTPSGQPIDVIATRRPYDDPGAPLYYRLRRVEGTIVHKTHIVYALSDARMAHLRQLFLGKDWKPTQYPGHAADVASNPFVAFAEIPARSRYQFLLDDAHFFVDTFIRGPVCRGQVAVDVIEDRFWVAFLAPDRDLSVTDPFYLEKTKDLLALPSEDAGWLEYNRKQRKYLNERERFYDRHDPDHRGPALDWIWNGDGKNPNALLTVFRNFDNATVVQGFAGATPKTAWILDYPLFERIYYDLVAGYDVFGAATHQVATRLYMDHLRMQSENEFLTFLPTDRREAIRASWYVGATKQLDYFLADRLEGMDHGTQVVFTTDDPKAELLAQILRRNAAIAGPDDLLNRCATPPCDRAGATVEEKSVERALQKLASVKGPWVSRLPEVSMLRVPAGGDRSLAYALVRDVAHTNVAMMFGEDERIVPADDTLSVVRGPFGSYPNFFFEVKAEEVEAFVDALRAVATDADYEGFVTRYGVRRTGSRFWAFSDWLHQDGRRADATRAGLHDLDRYTDP
jgi:hypothetical protein